VLDKCAWHCYWKINMYGNRFFFISLYIWLLLGVPWDLQAVTWSVEAGRTAFVCRIMVRRLLWRVACVRTTFAGRRRWRVQEMHQCQASVDHACWLIQQPASSTTWLLCVEQTHTMQSTILVAHLRYVPSDSMVLLHHRDAPACSLVD